MRKTLKTLLAASALVLPVIAQAQTVAPWTASAQRSTRHFEFNAPATHATNRQPHHNPRGSNFGKYLLGDDGGASNFSTYTGLPRPMIQGCGSSSAISGAGYGPKNCQFQMYMSLGHVDNPSEAAAAAQGQYNSQYAATLKNVVDPYAKHIYFIRIDSEWQNQINTYSPFYGSSWGDESKPAVDPQTYAAGVRQLVNVIRADPALANVKIAWDAPVNNTEQQYYPGNQYIDLFTYDLYFGAGGGPTDKASWNTYSPSLVAMDKFAGAHGKPYAIPEWCAYYPDGYTITQMGNWINSHNVVENSYWDSTYNAVDSNGNLCPINQSQQKIAAYTAAFGNYRYIGSFWPKNPHLSIRLGRRRTDAIRCGYGRK